MSTHDLNQLWKTYQLIVTDEIANSPEDLFCNGSTIGTLGKFFLRFATKALRGLVQYGVYIYPD